MLRKNSVKVSTYKAETLFHYENQTFLGNATGNNGVYDMVSLAEEVDIIATSFDQSVSSCFSQVQSDTLHCYVTHAGGFAVLQETITPTAIIIEKAGKSAQSKSKLIKSGDTVVFKMAGRYLSLHRGWWLKWVAAASSKNPYFIIHKNDREFTNCNEQLRESKSIYLTLGNSFCLKHRRWSKYSVGVSAEESTVSRMQMTLTSMLLVKMNFLTKELFTLFIFIGLWWTYAGLEKRKQPRRFSKRY
jgi:hypothetical protein